jgi:hypothetical protein
MVEQSSIVVQEEQKEQNAIAFANEMKEILIQVITEKNINGEQFVDDNFMQIAFTHDIVEKYNLTAFKLQIISMIRQDLISNQN